MSYSSLDVYDLQDDIYFIKLMIDEWILSRTHQGGNDKDDYKTDITAL